MGKKFKTVKEVSDLVELAKKKQQEKLKEEKNTVTKWDNLDAVTPASVLKSKGENKAKGEELITTNSKDLFKKLNGEASQKALTNSNGKDHNESNLTLSSNGSSKKQKKNRRKSKNQVVEQNKSPSVNTSLTNSNNVFLDVMQETSRRLSGEKTKSTDENRKRKHSEPKSDDSVLKVVPAKKRVIESEDDMPNEIAEERSPYIVESPPSSRDGKHGFSYSHKYSSIESTEDDDEESGITLTEESEFDEDEEDGLYDLNGFIANDEDVTESEVTDEEGVSDEDEELADEGDLDESNEDEEGSQLSLGDMLLAKLKKKGTSQKSMDEDKDLCENLSIDGYNVDYANFRQGCLVLTKKKKFHSVQSKFELFMFNTNHSLQAALEAFRWLINPFDVQLFFRGIFQKRALVIKRGSPNFFSGLFSTSSFVKMLQNNYLEYGVNINIAKYTNGVRTTLNGTGRVYTGDVMKSYNEGCSIQCTNPQAFNDEIWYFCEILQELFCSFVGANTYLTPPNSSGFAPHWDDIDAFIVQTEGRKHWKVYTPKNPREALPLESSGNFTEADMVGRKIVFNDWLEQGDVLYIPRGFIHQAFTDEKSHSHHVTVSVNRKIAFVDMIEKILPDVVNLVAEQHKEMRFSLPPNAFDMAGVIDMRYDNEEAAEQRILTPLVSVAKNIQKAVTEYFEAGVDQMALEFMKTALPPMLTPEEQALSVFGKQGIDLLSDKPVKITLNSQVRLIRKHAQRLIFETEDSYFLAHRMANSRVYEGRPEQNIPIPAESITGYISLMDAYPEWIKVKDLDCNSKKENIAFAGLLYSNGLILLKPAANEKEQLELPSSEPKNGNIKKTKKRNTTA